MRYYLILSVIFYLLVFANGAFAQRNYQDGYVVTNHNDTIYGRIRDRSPETTVQIFKMVRMKGFWFFEKKYRPTDIISYRIQDRTFESLWFYNRIKWFKSTHISAPGQGEKVFMRLTYEGKLKLYWDEFRDLEGGYEVQVPYFKKVGSEEMVRVTQGLFGFKKKRLAEFFVDCPDLIERLYDGFFDGPTEIAEFYDSNCY